MKGEGLNKYFNCHGRMAACRSFSPFLANMPGRHYYLSVFNNSIPPWLNRWTSSILKQLLTNADIFSNQLFLELLKRSFNTGRALLWALKFCHSWQKRSITPRFSSSLSIKAMMFIILFPEQKYVNTSINF